MKPYVICHMLGSVDGRITGANWGIKNTARYFEEPAAKIIVDAWMVGRTTMQEFCSQKPYRIRKGFFNIPKVDFVSDFVTAKSQKKKTYAVAIDPSGKCHWNTNMVSTEHVIEVLTEKVSSEYLDHLRSKNVSYIFGGKTELNLDLVLRKLRKLFGIKRLRLDGGGHNNGSFLKAGLIDEFSLVLAPVADGTIGSLSVFEINKNPKQRKAAHFKLKSVRKIYKNFLWIRYLVEKK